MNNNRFVAYHRFLAFNPQYSQSVNCESQWSKYLSEIKFRVSVPDWTSVPPQFQYAKKEFLPAGPFFSHLSQVEHQKEQTEPLDLRLPKIGVEQEEPLDLRLKYF